MFLYKKAMTEWVRVLDCSTECSRTYTIFDNTRLNWCVRKGNFFFYNRKIQASLSFLSFKTMACIAERTESDRNFLF